MNLKKHYFPKDSFIQGWYIPEKICDDLINYYNKFEKNAIGKMVIADGLVKSAGIASNILASLFLTTDELSPLVEGENQSKTIDTQSKNT